MAAAPDAPVTSLDISDRRRRAALAIAAVAMLLAAFVGTATNIAIPVLEEEFSNESLTHIAWVISGFAVTQVTFMLLGGRLADRIGRRRIFMIGLAVFAVGAALSAIAPTIDLVIAARVIQALGVALVIPSSLAAVLPLYPKDEHGTVVSLWSSMGVLGAAAAPTVAAGLLEVSSWRVVFAIAVPIALTGMVLASRYMADDTVVDRPPPLDLLGTITGTLAIGGATFVIVQGRAWGWFDSRIIVVFFAAALGLIFFIRSSRTHDEPLLDLDLLHISSFTVVTAASALVSISTSATWFLYPLFLNDVWDYSNLEVGLSMTPGPLTLVLFAPIAGKLVDRYGYRELLILGATLATAGTAWMAWRLRADETYVRAFLPGTLSIGLGMAFLLGPSNAAALRDVPAQQLGAANAAFNTARSAFSAFGVAVTTAIIGSAVVGERIEEFRVGWWSMTAVMSLSPLLLFARYRPHRVEAADRQPT
jgi:EmrB/QacA subfamily drug resistance transporter